MISAEVREACQSALPADYEICGTCDWDHSYDWPFLSPAQRKAAEKAHYDAGDGEFANVARNSLPA